MTAFLSELCNYLLRFVGADKVLAEYLLNVLYPFFDYIVFVGGTILPEKKFKDIDRNVCSFLDFLCQVFTDNFAVKVFSKLLLYNFSIVCSIPFHITISVSIKRS